MIESPLVVAALAKIIAQTGSVVFKDLSKKLKFKLQKINADFENYYKTSLSTLSYVKTIVNQEQRYFLKDLYVEQKFLDSQQKNIEELDLVEKLRGGENLLIKGHGGSGKTFFVKNTFFDLCENPKGSFPVFIELRELNKSRKSLKSNLIELLCPNNAKLFEALAKQGKFTFILDGFDEVELKYREKVADQVLKLCNAYPDCGVLLSSRYSEELSGWHTFLSYSVQDFKIEQTLELYDKIEYPDELKEGFVRQIDAKFFKENKPFLSSPLLALMMLVTFATTDQIPTKISEYYDLSFRAIFYRHDSMKRLTRRRVLSFSEFERFFSYFCLISYCEGKFSFNEKQYFALIKRTLDITSISIDAKEISREMTEATCLIHKDGLDYVFIHRSYQEYFCALCIINNITKTSNKEQLYLQVGKNGFDSVTFLAYEINSDDVERHYLIPKYNVLKSSISNIKRSWIFTFFLSDPSEYSEENPRPPSFFYSASFDKPEVIHFLRFIAKISVKSSDSFVLGFKLPVVREKNIIDYIKQNYPNEFRNDAQNKVPKRFNSVSLRARGDGLFKLLINENEIPFSEDKELYELLNFKQAKSAEVFLSHIEATKDLMKQVIKRNNKQSEKIDNLLL